MNEQRNYDTIILGAGLAGSALAAILAKQGFSVLVLEKGSLPQFAIGESLLPQSVMWMWLLGQQYDVPELTHLSHLDTIIEHVTPSCGLKRTLGFLYHREGLEQNPLESHQLIPPILPMVQESHLYREDVDLYMLNAAKAYGISYRERTTVQDLHIDDDGVRISVEGGETFCARYLVDSSGYRSLAGHKFGLREEPSRLRTRSRTIFTHMTELKPYDRSVPSEHLPKQSHGWYEGTLHHVFDGGWFWIIPFDNHAKAANGRCSVGLTLDMNKFPPRDVAPEEEFWEVVGRFPSIARHLDGAKPVRNWVGTRRLQYSARACSGPRYFLLSHSYGFIDALYSRGLIMTFETVHGLAGQLIAALREDDFSNERFAHLERLQAKRLEHADTMVYNAYRAMGHFATWNAWTKIWLATKLYGDIWLFRSCLKYLQHNDVSTLERLHQEEAPFAPQMQHLIHGAEHFLDQVETGQLEPDAAGEAILALLEGANWLPQHVYGWGKRDVHHVDFTPASMLGRVLLWGKTSAPKHLRKGFFDLPIATLLGLQLKEKFKFLRKDAGRLEAKHEEADVVAPEMPV